MKAIDHADQLRGDAHLPALAPHAAFDDVGHAELAPDLAHVAALAFELEHRSTRRDVELRNLRQDVQQFLGHAVGEIFLVRLAAHVCKRQDGDGRTAARRNIAGSVRRLALEVPAQR